MKSITLFIDLRSPFFNRQFFPVAPLFPRSQVVANARKAEEPQREIAVRGAIASLAVRNHFLVGRDAGGFVHRAQLCVWLERAVLGEIAGPLDVYRARNRAATLRARHLP